MLNSDRLAKKMGRPVAHYQPDNRSLLEEVECLREEVARLKEILAPPTLKQFFRTELGFTELQSYILAVIVSRRFASHDTLLQLMYDGKNEPDNSAKVLENAIYEIRRKLRAANIDVTLSPIYGEGLTISAQDCAILKRLADGAGYAMRD